MDITPVFVGALLGSITVTVFALPTISELKKELLATRNECNRLRNERKEAEECGQGIDVYHERLQHKKNTKKQQILTALQLKKKIANQEIVELLNVSSATAVRYADELEAEGAIRQIGSTGRGVYYTLNTSK